MFSINIDKDEDPSHSVISEFPGYGWNHTIILHIPAYALANVAQLPTYGIHVTTILFEMFSRLFGDVIEGRTEKLHI